MKKVIQNFFLGEEMHAFQYLGAHPHLDGYIFRVYAPKAKKIELIGDFNHWNGKNHCLKKINSKGFFELYVPEIKKNYETYKFHILTSKNTWIDKADPYAFFSELRPSNASKTFDINHYIFHDAQWMAFRNKNQNRPLNIYELHLGSWLKKEDNTWYSYEEIVDKLITYIQKNHFTHVEFMPLLEYPFDGSWGYQCSGFFSITSRYGNPDQLKYLIDQLHQNQIGVILDYVVLHFVKDAFSLGRFDGSHLYESYWLDQRHSPWDTYLFDFSKPEVMSFVLSSLTYLIEYFHIDGIRFDAISNLIFHQGNKNLGVNESGLNFIKKMNHLLSFSFPTVMLIAEDSSDFEKVTTPTFEGGLGFDYKWDLGWMNDTFAYLKIDPLYRGNHIQKITFSMYYFYSEKFLLPLSHDEVVHMKNTVINKIWGSYEDKFKQLKTLYTYMFTHPGKKLNFMGNELALFEEWNENKAIPFDILKYPIHDSFHQYFIALNSLYLNEPALYQQEYNPQHFQWLMCENAAQNIFIYQRTYQQECLITILNFAPMQYPLYRFGINQKKGSFKEILNSDKFCYHGNNFINEGKIAIESIPSHGKEQSIQVKIPSFGALILKYIT